LALVSSLDTVAYTDSDWAVCVKTRTNTSWMVLQILGCPVTAQSRTQQALALSSGEAELYAIGAAVLKALRQLDFLMERGIVTRCRSSLQTDSSAAKPMASRFGATYRIWSALEQPSWLTLLDSRTSRAS